MQRLDPYKNFKFRLRFDGRHVFGANQLTGLPQVSTPLRFRSGGDPSTSRKSPGRTKFEGITLERGITQDSAFQNWAGLAWSFGASPGLQTAPENFRKDIYLEFYDDAGILVNSYQLSRCWVSKYRALPNLGGNANAVAIEHIRIECEGLLPVPR